MDVDPLAEIAKLTQRMRMRQANGRETGADRARAELVEDVRRQLEDQIAADDRPISEMVPEYVMVYDEDGNYVGLTKKVSEMVIPETSATER